MIFLISIIIDWLSVATKLLILIVVYYTYPAINIALSVSLSLISILFNSSKSAYY